MSSITTDTQLAAREMLDAVPADHPIQQPATDTRLPAVVENTMRCVNCQEDIEPAGQCPQCGHCPGCGAPPYSSCDCRYNCTGGDDCVCLSCITED